MKALLVVDVQYDFLPGGSLEVPEGDQVIPVINDLMKKFDFVVATQDWHPADHGSFASQHEGKEPGDKIELDSAAPILLDVYRTHDDEQIRTMAMVAASFTAATGRNGRTTAETLATRLTLWASEKPTAPAA